MFGLLRYLLRIYLKSSVFMPLFSMRRTGSLPDTCVCLTLGNLWASLSMNSFTAGYLASA